MTRASAGALKLIGMVVVMIIGGAVAGAAAGLILGAAYQITITTWLQQHGSPTNLGGQSLGSLGAVLGMAFAGLACIPCCWGIIAAHRRSLGGWRLVGRGALLGATTGGLSAFMVNVGIVLLINTDATHPQFLILNPLVLVVSLACGATIGAILGAIGGHLADGRRPEPTVSQNLGL